MLEIIFYEKNHRYAIAAKGHAEYAPHGYDIVCSAVSTLLQSYGNYLQELEKYSKLKVLEIKFNEGDINVEVLDSSDRVKDLYRMTMLGIEAVYETYPKFLHLNYNEP